MDFQKRKFNVKISSNNLNNKKFSSIIYNLSILELIGGKNELIGGNIWKP